MTEQTEREALETLWRETYGMSPAGVMYDCGAFGSRPGHADRQRAEQFTAMLDAGAYLDAAMLLVPEGWTLASLHESSDPDDAPEYLWYSSIYKRGTARRAPFGPGDVFWAAASTPALALCAAIRAAKDAQYG